VLSLGNNNLNGSIPAELGDLTNLTQLQLPFNQLSGSLPAELCNLTDLTLLTINNNNLQGSYPGCMSAFCNVLLEQKGILILAMATTLMQLGKIFVL